MVKLDTTNKVQSRLFLNKKTHSNVRQYATHNNIPFSIAVEKLLMVGYKEFLKKQLEGMENESK